MEGARKVFNTVLASLPAMAPPPALAAAPSLVLKAAVAEQHATTLRREQAAQAVGPEGPSPMALLLLGSFGLSATAVPASLPPLVAPLPPLVASLPPLAATEGHTPGTPPGTRSGQAGAAPEGHTKGTPAEGHWDPSLGGAARAGFHLKVQQLQQLQRRAQAPPGAAPGRGGGAEGEAGAGDEGGAGAGVGQGLVGKGQPLVDTVLCSAMFELLSQGDPGANAGVNAGRHPGGDSGGLSGSPGGGLEGARRALGDAMAALFLPGQPRSLVNPTCTVLV